MTPLKLMQIAHDASGRGDSRRSLPYEVVLDMIEMSSDACLLLNGDWETVHANQSALRLLGQDLGDFVGRPLEEALGEQCVQAAREKVARDEDGLSAVNDFPQSKGAPDASRIETSINSSEAPIEVEVEVQKSGELILALIRPRSGPHKYQERIVELEDELRELRATMAVSQELLRNNNIEVNKSLEKMQAMYGELDESNRSATQFLANMSHELRTPLNAIIGFLDIILEGLCENDEERTHFLESSLGSANHLLELINDILEVTKIQSGKMTVELCEVDVREIFEQIKDMFEVQARKKDLDLEFEVADPDRPSVFCDSEKLKRVLLNLVSNAIKFTPKGRVRVVMEPYPDDPRTAIISVEDTGIGIPKDQHRRVFERFTQGDGSSTRQYEGTGLGLAICKSLVEKMGGHIWIVKSEENKGTTISFTLPTTSEALETDSTEAPESTDDDIRKLLPDTF